jgi:hypothetical protein
LQAKLHQVITQHIHPDGLPNSETKRSQIQRKRLQHQVERLNVFF